MFTKRRLLSFFLTLLFVASVGGWIFGNVKGEFLALSRDTQRRTVAAAAASYPSDPEDVEG